MVVGASWIQLNLTVASFLFLAAVVILLFRDTTRIDSQVDTDVSDKHTASIFRAEGGNSMFLQKNIIILVVISLSA
jgi:hypothetical protein